MRQGKEAMGPAADDHVRRAPIMRSHIAGIILAGGQGIRIGGGKPLRPFLGRPLVARVIESIRRQVAELWVSVRGNGEQLTGLGLRVVEDERGGGLDGPVAGIVASLGAAAASGFSAVAVVPCDAPFVPRNLVGILAAALTRSEAPGIVIATGAGLQPTFALWRIEARDPLRAAAASGLQLRRICLQMGAAVLNCRDAGIDEAAFGNVNTREELETLELVAAAARTPDGDEQGTMSEGT